LKIDELLLAIEGTPVPQPHELADEEDAEPEPSPASPTDDSSSSDSSSDSSSSSSSHDKKKKKSKKKKSKKVKKEKKKRKQKAAKKAAAALAKREKLAEKKAAQKQADKEKSSAEKAAKAAKKESEQKKIHAAEILHKVNGPLQGLNSQMGHTRLSELPESIVASSQAAQNDLVAIAENAVAVKQGVSENLLFPSKQVGSFIAEARKMETIVKSMISALQKLKR
jgi:DNA mismatch repair ATPase MutL